MRTRGSDATGPVPTSPAASSSRELRPRQASGARGTPAGGTVPRVGGRLTRSSAAVAQPHAATNTNSSDAVPPAAALGTSAQSHKRSRSSVASSAQQQAKRTRRSHHLPGFYGEESESESGDGLDSPDVIPAAEVELNAGTRRQPKSSQQQQQQQLVCRPLKTPSPKKKASQPNGSSKELSASEETNDTVSDAFIPDWASLPYLILVQIFRYASVPLTEPQQAKWLTAASGVCRAFAEPALTALYENPPLFTRPMAHGLVALLSEDPATTLFNYRPKVEELSIDVEHIVSKTHKGRPLDLQALIANLPRIKSIQFFHQKDEPPYRTLDGSLRWQYPTALFQALNGTQDAPTEGEAPKANPSQLLGWQWNRRMMGPELDLAGIKTLHLTLAFRGLKEVSFVNYQVPSLHAKETDDDTEMAALDHAFIQLLAGAIDALPDLERLSFQSSTAVNDQLLPLLPKTLKALELVNCWDISSDDFASYLLSSGYQLRRLSLHHNQSLSLSFVTILGAACPNLELFCMDFKTFNHHEFYHDSDPSYDQLLAPDQVPDWPENLEILQLLNMKKWGAAAANTLFQSLVDSAPKLLKLRRLELKAMLSIPIQERSQLRNKWDRKLKQVFLREKTVPLPLFSLRKLAQQQPVCTEEAKKKQKKHGKSTTGGSARRSTRLAEQYSTPSSRASSVGRDLRHGLGRPSYVEPDTDEDADLEDEDNDDKGNAEGERSGSDSASPPATPGAPAAAPPPFRHGMCEKVEIQLDNQKSAERTLTMDDFLDSEHDDLSDDDWVGEDEDFDTEYAW
ncbi:hypothetical protein C8A05DRAFT_43391 [Staphylotrichum tortipilum]|uniref:F-box domain-containing protein n=1 Tax=Staphylotrichum tortipilum TaxID=2831512 RepID=A0AAN6RV84_9PEZI|nr:hypothetical protein C8A05DRAFT_43391 [Staphylotrichum longicolle]